MRAFLLDDEPLAARRLERLLREAGGVEIAGSSNDPEDALAALQADPVDVLFLDIEMPGMSGFDLLARLSPQPFVIFTTAYDRYALEAFRANSVDYLLKPIEPADLARALDKLRLRAAPPAQPADLARLVEQVAAALESRGSRYLTRISSRTGDKLEVVDALEVAYFQAREKLTFAVCPPRNLVVDLTISDLERRLDPKHFVRIHRSVVVNLSQVREVHTWFTGKASVRLKSGNADLPVSRERLAELKRILGA